jgi:hypothetical protein
VICNYQTERETGTADAIYRPFFTSAIVLTLTFGATWGAWLLWRIGVEHSFTKVSLFEINAHGHAQIYGWMTLFIMGFAYQALPRFWQTQLKHPILAVVTFIAMVFGVILSTVGMALHGNWAGALPATMLGDVLEIGSVALFSFQIISTYHATGRPVKPYVAFIFAALAWLNISEWMNLAHGWLTMTATGEKQLLWYVATLQAPLRDFQVHGVGLTLILGMSLLNLPKLFGLPNISCNRVWWSLGLLTAAVALESGLFLAYRLLNNHVFAALLMVPWIMLVIAVWIVVVPWKLWRQVPEPDRSTKFIRTAYLWLAASLLLLLLLPLYQKLVHIPFSHAYYGAIRHAITVGFISMSIMGYGSKVVPVLCGRDWRKLDSLWVPFLLINAGCFVRVSTQILTDWNQSYFAVIAISGLCEVTALTIWGLSLLKLMWIKSDGQGRILKLPIQLTDTVADVVHSFPKTESVFMRFGFNQINNPVLLNTVAKTVTIGQAARMRNVEPLELTTHLNRAAID